MPNIQLTEDWKIKGVAATLDATDGTKVTVTVNLRSFVGHEPVDVQVVLPGQAMNTWDGSYWTGDFPDNVSSAFDEAGYDVWVI